LSFTKPELRKQSRQILQSLSVTEKNKASQQIETLLQDFIKNQTGYWACFRPLPDEVQINWSHLVTKVRWVYPKLISSTEMQFMHSTHPRFVRNEWGVEEPVEDEMKSEVQWISRSELQGLFIPGLAFTASGVRLGRGKGYYDRYLKDFSGLRIGVCFSRQLFSQLPQDESDVGMTHVLSENGWIDI